RGPAGHGRHGLQPGVARGVLRAPHARLDDRGRLHRDPEEPHRRRRLRPHLFATARQGLTGTYEETNMKRRILSLAALAACAWSIAVPAAADAAYPAKPVRIIVGYSAGGP